MTLPALLVSLLAAASPQPLACQSGPGLEAISITARSGAYDGREFSIQGHLLSDYCWLGPQPLHLSDRYGSRCLSPSELEALGQAIAATDFFALPPRLEFSPYYVDEAYATVEVTLGTEHAAVFSAGLERANSLEGIRFRNFWRYLVALADSSGSSCGVAPNPSLQRTPPG